MIGLIRQVSLADKRLIMKHIRAPWLEILHGLTVLEPTSYPDQRPLKMFKEHLKIWNAFGVVVGLNCDELLHERALERSVEMGGLSGCSWIRCPLFEATEVVTQRDFMRCSRCRKVRSFSNRSVRSRPYLVISGPVLWPCLSTDVRPLFSDFRVKS